MLKVVALLCFSAHFIGASYVVNMEKNTAGWQKHILLIDESTGKFTVEENRKLMMFDFLSYPNAAAIANFKSTINQNGWAQLEITTSPSFNSSTQAYAAGYLEGTLTKEFISNRTDNTVGNFCSPMTEYCSRLQNFIEENMEYMLSKINSDPYWEQVYYVLLQLQGLEDGYKHHQPDLSIRLDPFGLLLHNIDGDLEDLQTALNGTEQRVLGSGSCSALIKLLPGYKDLYSAHDTWNSYQGMLRIMKKYMLNLKDANGNLIPGHTASFSSSPGALYSGDDFYILSSKLVTIETTIGNSNTSLWKYVKAKGTVFESIRNVVANRLSKTGKEWCEIFSKYNSGTYNNQWMIVDYNKFVSGQKPKSDDGLLYVLEQIPGTIEFKDVTAVLVNQTYWPSYNSPYFKKIFNDSGLPAMVAKYGDFFSHEKNPRARIFARDHSSVTDLKHLIKLMRYNDFKHDPLSACNCTPPYSAENAIAARSDLNPRNGTYPLPMFGFRNHGATDVKVTSSKMVRNYEMIAECGPTHDQQPVFMWSTSPFANLSHKGMPDRYDFEPTFITWVKKDV